MASATDSGRPVTLAVRLRVYAGVLNMFLQNSLIRDMSFRSNFLLQCASSVCWALMNIGFYLVIFSHTDGIGLDTGWRKYEFFVFLATTWFVNSLVQTFFMPNAQRFSELIRTGEMDFALLKPIDTQFLISFQRVEWSSLSNFLVGAALLAVALWRLTTRPEDPLQVHPIMVLLYPFYLVCGVAIMYSVMISLAASSIWMGRNQSLYNFWFYITNFSRYPMEIYARGWGIPIWGLLTFVVPVLVVVNVPARLLAQPLHPRASWEWPLAGFAVAAAIGSLAASRFLFQRALRSYRSASS